MTTARWPKTFTRPSVRMDAAGLRLTAAAAGGMPGRDVRWMRVVSMLRAAWRGSAGGAGGGWFLSKPRSFSGGSVMRTLVP